MSNTEAVEQKKAPALKYWLTATRDFNGGTPSLHIRIEWTANGTTRSAYGSFWPSDGDISWQYDAPPSALNTLAVGCCFDAGDGYDDTLHGAEYMGQETVAQMDHQVAARCSCCGVVQADEDCLSENGECPKCWAHRMADAEANEPDDHVDSIDTLGLRGLVGVL